MTSDANQINGLNELQRKIRDAINSLSAARLMAEKNARAYRAAGNLPRARYYEGIAADLQDNVAHSLSCLVNRLEGTTELSVTDEPTREEIENDTADLLRYVRMRR